MNNYETTITLVKNEMSKILQIFEQVFDHKSFTIIRSMEIVKKTTNEFNLPYNEFNTFLDAIRAHFRFLKTMGMKPQNT